MRGYIFFFYIIITIVPVFAVAQKSADFYKDAKLKKSATLHCLYNHTPGFSYKDEKGNMKGFCVDVMEQFKLYVKQKEGIDVSLSYEEEKAKEFNSFLNHVKQGQGGVFGLGSITLTEERSKNYKLSPRIIKSFTLIVTHKDVPDLHSLNDIPLVFKGMTGYAVKGTSFEKRLMEIRDKYYHGLQIKNKPPGLDSFENLLNQKNTLQNIDFMGYLTVLKRDMAIKRHPLLDVKEELCLVMAQNNDWDMLFNQFLNSVFLESTIYRKLIADNFGAHSLKLLDSVK